MCGGGLRAAPGKSDCFEGHKVLHEQVSLVVFVPRADAVFDAQLNRLHQLIHVDLLVRHLTRVIHPSVADLPLFVSRRRRGRPLAGACG